MSVLPSYVRVLMLSLLSTFVRVCKLSLLSTFFKKNSFSYHSVSMGNQPDGDRCDYVFVVVVGEM